MYVFIFISKCHFLCSCRAVSAMPFSLFFPVVPWLLQIILFGWFVGVLAYPLTFEMLFNFNIGGY